MILKEKPPMTLLPSVPKPQSSGNPLPVHPPIDDGMRSQMFNLSPALRRRSGSPLLSGLADPAPRKRKAKVSVDKELPLPANEGQSDPNLVIRLEEAVEKRHQQFRLDETPVREHIAIESAKGSGNMDGNNGPLTPAIDRPGSLKKISAAQKRSKLWINDLYLYLRHLVQYGAKRPSQKEVIRVQSLVSVIFAGEIGLNT